MELNKHSKVHMEKKEPAVVVTEIMKRKSRDRALLSTSPSAHSKMHLKATTLLMMYIQDYQQNGTGRKYA